MIYIKHLREGILTGHHELFHCLSLGTQSTVSVMLFYMNKVLIIHTNILSNEYCKIYQCCQYVYVHVCLILKSK